jgi:hypothetical protein
MFVDIYDAAATEKLPKPPFPTPNHSNQTYYNQSIIL